MRSNQLTATASGMLSTSPARRRQSNYFFFATFLAGFFAAFFAAFLAGFFTAFFTAFLTNGLLLSVPSRESTHADIVVQVSS